LAVKILTTFEKAVDMWNHTHNIGSKIRGHAAVNYDGTFYETHADFGLIDLSGNLAQMKQQVERYLENSLAKQIIESLTKSVG
jgi:hypothetical protein